MLTVAVAARVDNGRLVRPAIVVGGVTAHPQRLGEVEQRISGNPVPDSDSVAALVRDQVEASDDPRASAEFKRYLAGTLVARCLVEVVS